MRQKKYFPWRIVRFLPVRPAHLNKANNNEKLLINEMSSTSFVSYLDWVVTVAFYTALHYVDACLARYAIHPVTHGGRHGRNAEVSRRLRTVSAKYQTLYNKCRYARYVPLSERNLRPIEVVRLVSWVINDFKTLP